MRAVGFFKVLINVVPAYQSCLHKRLNVFIGHKVVCMSVMLKIEVLPPDNGQSPVRITQRPLRAMHYPQERAVLRHRE